MRRLRPRSRWSLITSTHLSWKAITKLIADSGNRVERGFCPRCGSQMYSKTVEPAGLPMRVRAGTLDDPEIMPPSRIIWASSAPSWAPLDPALPQHGKGPDSEIIEGTG